MTTQNIEDRYFDGKPPRDEIFLVVHEKVCNSWENIVRVILLSGLQLLKTSVIYGV